MQESEYVIQQEDETAEYSRGEQILFEPSASVRIGFGGYSTVYKEVIPVGHFRHRPGSNFPISQNPTPLPVARKWSPYTPDFDRELLFLETLNSSPNHGHDRIMKHLAVVMKPPVGSQPPTLGKHSLLFPLADLDLEKLLSTEDLSKFDFKDLVKELFHLADALSFLHSDVKTSKGTSLTGSHMDLNPKDILVFRGRREGEGEQESSIGTWKITDFSTSTLTDEDGHNYLSPPKLVPEVYMAPEIQDVVEKNIANPACDIWSLGCIIFEVLVGHVGQKLGKAWKDRRGSSKFFYEREGQEVRIERWVWKQLDAHVTDVSVGICARLVMDMLRVDPKERPTSEQVRNRLELL